MVVWQLFHLAGGSIDQTLFPETDGNTPKTGHAFNVAFAIDISDINPLALVDHERPGLFLLPGICIGMKLNRDIAGFKGIWELRHEPPLRPSGSIMT